MAELNRACRSAVVAAREDGGRSSTASGLASVAVSRNREATEAGPATVRCASVKCRRIAARAGNASTASPSQFGRRTTTRSPNVSALAPEDLLTEAPANALDRFNQPSIKFSPGEFGPRTQADGERHGRDRNRQRPKRAKSDSVFVRSQHAGRAGLLHGSRDAREIGGGVLMMIAESDQTRECPARSREC